MTRSSSRSSLSLMMNDKRSKYIHHQHQTNHQHSNSSSQSSTTDGGIFDNDVSYFFQIL